MKTQKILIVLTVINVALVAVTLVRTIPAAAQNTPPVLRGRALEIVDDHGRLRASISILPPVSNSPRETVIFRLIDQNGRPSVKLATSDQGAGMGLAGTTDATYITLDAQGNDSYIKLINKAGREQIVKP